MTPSTPSTMTRTTTTHANCTSVHCSALVVVLSHDPIGSSSLSPSLHPHVAHVLLSLILFDLSLYFNLSVPVFFFSSVLMFPDLHTDLHDPDSVENDLRHSAKGSLVTCDDTHSLTGYEPNVHGLQRHGLQRARLLPRSPRLRYSFIGPGHR